MSSGLTLLCLVVPFEAESFIIIVHLKPDRPPQAPVDVQQPLEDERSVFLHTRAATPCRDRQQSSALRLTWGGGYPAGRLPRWLCVRCTCRPRRSQHSQGRSLSWRRETPIRWEPPFYFKSTGVKSRLTGQAEEKWNITGGKILILSQSDSSEAWLTCSVSDVKIKMKYNKSPLCVWVILESFEETGFVSGKT